MNDRAVGDLLAVDPSVNKPGAALFRGGRLVAAERVKIDPEYKTLEPGERWNRVAASILRWGMAHNMEPRFLVYEMPQIYTGRKSKGDPNDLIGLAGVAAALGGQLSVALAPRDVSLSIVTPKPAEWVGQLPKSETGDPWASPRGMRVRSRLSVLELQGVVPTHDALDAVGLGLWALGRFDRIRMFPGATPG